MTTRVVHVGVARPSAKYGRNLANLKHYTADATAHVEELAGLLGVACESLIGTDATRAAVGKVIIDAANALRHRPKSLFVLSFTGHGGKIQDSDNDEVIDHQDEGWGLDDAPLVDDELMKLLREFDDSTTHVAILSNCCFAAGIQDELIKMRQQKAGGSSERPRLPLLEELRREQREDWFGVVRRLSASQRFVPLEGEAPPPPPPTTIVKRNRAVAAVCQANQKFLAPSKSRFTRQILDTVFPIDAHGGRKRARDATYAVLDDALQDIGIPSATPSVSAPPAVLSGPAFPPMP